MKMNFPRWRVPCLIILCLSAWSFVVRGQTTPPQGQAQGNDKGIGAEMARTPVEWPAGPKRFALIIGVDHYDDTQITTLGGASNDAKALKDALVRYAGFGEEQVTLLASDQPPERQPTRGNILRR